MAEPQTQNPLASIIQALMGQAKPRPDLQPQMQTTPQAAAIGALSGGATAAKPMGLLTPGTIQNLYNRKILRNPDGSVSTTRSMSFNENGKEILIPTVVEGKLLSPDQAIQHYHNTGEHLGIFDSPASADAYAKQLHNEQERRQGIGPRSSAPPVATFAGRVIRPGERPQDVLARLPEGGAPGEEGAMAPVAALPSAIGETIGRLGMFGTLRNIAKGLKGKFPTAVVDKEGLPKVVYHGTPQAFGEYSLEKAQPGLYGKGIYLTESPEVAGGTGALMPARGMAPNWGYATSRSNLTNNAISNKQLDVVMLNERRAKGMIGLDDYNQQKEALLREIKHLQGERSAQAAPNVRPAFVDIRKPFDMNATFTFQEADKILKAAKPFERAGHGGEGASLRLQKMFSSGELVDGDRIRGWLSRVVGDVNVNEVLKAAGYDGITHIGGSITGGAPHRVWIAFDPKQVKSVFDPELQGLSGYKPPVTQRNAWEGAAYRAETGYTHERWQTAADVVNYEQQVLGNKLGISPEVIAQLKDRPATDVVWVTRTKTAARRYGAPSTQDIPTGSTILATDGEGGYLVLKGKK